MLIVLAWQFFCMNPHLEAQRKADQAAKLQQRARSRLDDADPGRRRTVNELAAGERPN